jgi:DNA-binding winged helix-turn-helix (wHTH) protein
LETTNRSKNGALTNGHRYAFDNFEVDPANRLLLRDGQVVPLTGKVFDVLLVFAENPGRLLGKDELIEKIWQADFVEEGNLARNVSTLRKALGDAGKDHKYIVTVPGHG